jgi:predicted transcriptional regulator
LKLEDQATTTALAAEIVANFVANNAVSIEQLPDLIRTVHKALSGLGDAEPDASPAMAKPTPAQIRKSIRPEALVSFIDNKPYKTLKRHLAKHGLTIAEYKEKYGLSRDYPTTAAEYSAKRSQMARSLGLGRPAEAAPAPVEEPAAKPTAKRASKKPKAAPAA